MWNAFYRLAPILSPRSHKLKIDPNYPTLLDAVYIARLTAAKSCTYLASVSYLRRKEERIEIIFTWPYLPCDVNPEANYSPYSRCLAPREYIRAGRKYTSSAGIRSQDYHAAFGWWTSIDYCL